MKIAVLGGGFAGLSTAYYLKNHDITIFERAPGLGGLASGFRQPQWQWPIERAYHHLFANDDAILQFSKDVGFNKIFFQSPITASLFDSKDGGFEEIPFDSPIDLLKFKYFGPFDKIRTGVILAILKLFPLLSVYERETARAFMKKYTGEKSWKILWEQLFRKKFGKYAENILMAFLWARVHKRTKQLGYIEGGFQNFIDHIEKSLIDKGTKVYCNTTVNTMRRKRGRIDVVFTKGEKPQKVYFDKVISTLPSPVLRHVGQELFPIQYLKGFDNLQYLTALVLILETDMPILNNTYWLNICTPRIPMMLVGQHTNLIDKKHYGGHHMAYVGYYLDPLDPLLKIDAKRLMKQLSPHFNSINPSFKNAHIYNTFLFIGPYAQPLFTKRFLKYKPDFITPVKDVYIANLDMTYPYDRGTNYAVQLGKRIANQIS